MMYPVKQITFQVELLRNGTPLLTVVISKTFQLAYTSVFGAFSCYCLLATGSVS